MQQLVIIMRDHAADVVAAAVFDFITLGITVPLLLLTILCTVIQIHLKSLRSGHLPNLLFRHRPRRVVQIVVLRKRRPRLLIVLIASYYASPTDRLETIGPSWDEQVVILR